MNLNDIKKTTDKLIKHFIDCLGLDGQYYVSQMDTPIIFGSILGEGQFFTANSQILKERLARLNISEAAKKYYLDNGLIIINEKHKDKQPDIEFITTIIHETFHANRMLILNTQSKPNPDVAPIITYDDHFVQTSSSKKTNFADPNQDLYHGSIDTSANAMKKVSNLSKKKKKNMSFDDKSNDANELYMIVDEALVEIMSLISFYLVQQRSNDVMDIVKKLNRNYDGDIKHITNIIIRHNNLDLLKWMLDPLTYQAGDVSYDYLGHYLIAEDFKDIDCLYESEDYSDLSDYIPDELKKNSSNCK